MAYKHSTNEYVSDWWSAMNIEHTWRAYSTCCVEVSKEHALFRHLVQMWRLARWVAIATQIAPAHLPTSTT